MYSKSVHVAWKEKYDEKEAQKRYEEWCQALRGRTPHNKNNRPISQFNKDGVLINIYKGLADVEEKNPTFAKSNISKVLKGQRKTAYGFIWSY
jgi:hypothetical protein